jgi:hypothetical protein
MISAFALAFAFPAFGATYNRTPAGNENIEQPVTVSGTFAPEDVPEGTQSYIVQFMGLDSHEENMPCRNGTTTFNETTSNLYSGTSWTVSTYFLPDLDCFGEYLDNFQLEDAPGFTVLDYVPPVGGGITLSTSTASDVFGVIGYIFTDFWEIIALIIGLPLGFWLIKKITKTMPKERKEPTNYYNSDQDVSILKLAKLKYEAGNLSQEAYEKILDKYSK